MPTPTYVAIAKTVLTGTQASIVMSSIPQTYTDLLLVCSARDSSSSNGYTIVQVNSLNSGFSETDLRWDGSSVTSIRATGDNKFFAQGYLRIPISTYTANTFGSTEIYFPNYAGSTNKVASAISTQENNSATTTYLTASAALLQNTVAITSLTITTETTFASGSRFDLYGIKNS